MTRTRYSGMKRQAIVRACDLCGTDLTAKPTAVNNFGHETRALRAPSYTQITVQRHGQWTVAVAAGSPDRLITLSVCSTCLRVDARTMQSLISSNAVDKLRALALLFMGPVEIEAAEQPDFAGEGI